MTVRRLLLALTALFALPAAGSAGPIEFSFTASGKSHPDPGAYSPGELAFSLTPQGEVSLPAEGGSVELGAVEFWSSLFPVANDTYTAYANFDVSVTVTDRETGESGKLMLYGTALDDWTYRSWDGRWLNIYHRLELGDIFAGNTASTSTVIGDTRYTLSVRPEADNQVAVYELSATIANPEPGTFALAALGLAPLALRRLRRMGFSERGA
jgi:hypothetical protein